MVQALMTSRRASWVIAGLLPLVLHWLLKHLSWKRYLCHEGVELFIFFAKCLSNANRYDKEYQLKD